MTTWCCSRSQVNPRPQQVYAWLTMVIFCFTVAPGSSHSASLETVRTLSQTFSALCISLTGLFHATIVDLVYVLYYKGIPSFHSPYFVPGLPHVILIELTQSLISY